MNVPQVVTNVVEFLERDDIMVGQGDGGIVVHHRYWKFEGRAPNVIMAARQAMLAEQKLKEMQNGS